MKFSKILIGITMCLPLTLQATTDESFIHQLPIHCDNTVKLMRIIKETYKEELAWSGNHDNDSSYYSLWTNEENGSWTLLKMTPSISCVLGTGQGSTPVDMGSDRVSWKLLFM